MTAQACRILGATLALLVALAPARAFETEARGRLTSPTSPPTRC